MSDNTAGDNALTRFLGGKPGAVFVKLAIISIIVGALLHLAGLSPIALLRGIEAMVRSIIGSGWDAVRNIAEFALYGAMIVVPVWLIARAMSAKKG
jgi:Family of unknown function (DUF6460)